MALRPIDLQNIVNASVEVAKVAQTRNDTLNMHQGQFAIQLQRDTERKQEQVQKGKGGEGESTKIKDEEKQKGKQYLKEKEDKKGDKESTKKNTTTLIEGKEGYHHIDIKI